MKTFQMAMTPEERALMGRAVARWNDPLGAPRAAGETVEIPRPDNPPGASPRPLATR